MKLGLLHNPRSARNLGQPPPVPPPGVAFASPDTLEGLVLALRGFAAEGVELVMINGGDGAVREVLTALPQTYGDAWPKIAVFAGGGTNLIAADVGAGRLEPGLASIVAAQAAGTLDEQVKERRTLRLVWPDGERTPVIGMFFGAAALVEATDLGEGALRSRGALQGPMVAMTIAAAMMAALAGPSRRRWLAGQPIGVAELSEGSPAPAPRFLLMATTLTRLMLGLWPFFGDGPGFHYLDMAAPPKRLLRGLLPIVTGKPRPWMAAAGHRSGRSEGLLLHLSERFIVDGERFMPGASGLIRLEAGPTVRFFSP
jgi:hypothetical protein